MLSFGTFGGWAPCLRFLLWLCDLLLDYGLLFIVTGFVGGFKPGVVVLVLNA